MVLLTAIDLAKFGCELQVELTLRNWHSTALEEGVMGSR